MSEADQFNSIDTSVNPCLLVGLGGTGVQVLRKLKTQFLQKSPELLAEDGQSGSVVFLSLDTEQYNKTEKHHPLTAGEYQSMGVGVRPAEIVQRNYHEEGDHGLKSVWPTALNRDGSDSGLPYELPPDKTITMGASQNRLIGRVALFYEADTVYQKINQMLDKFFGLENVKSDQKTPPQIHVIGSIAGGTGSSLILDVPYLIRLAAEKSGREVFVTGHFVTSGPFEYALAGAPDQLERTSANTYTCLKELDYIYRRNALNADTGQQEPLWEVKYSQALATIDTRGLPTHLAKIVPLDWINLYGKQNEFDIAIKNPDHTFDIIAQAISYNINGGINTKSLSHLDNILQKSKELSTNGKAKPYGSLGVSTLELPNDSLTHFMAFRWAQQLCDLKGDNENQYEKTDDQKAMWRLMMQWELEQLQAIVLPDCPIYRKNSAGQWEKIEGEREIKQNWPKLADAYGLNKPRFNHRDDIVDAILEVYGDKNVRLKEATSFRENGERKYNDYVDQLKKASQEKIADIKNRLDETLVGIGDFAFSQKSEAFEDEPILRSTDAYSKSIDDLVKGISRIYDQVSLIQQDAEKRQHSSEARADTKVLEESKFSLLGAGPRKGQVSEWADAAKMAIDSKAQAEQAKWLKSALHEIREYLGSEIQAKVEAADEELTDFQSRSKAKADKVQAEMKKQETEKAVSVFLIPAENFESFVSERAGAFKKRSNSIWARVKELIRQNPPARCQPTLIDALASGRGHTILGKPDKVDDRDLGFLETACIEAARQEMSELKFQEFVEENFLDQKKEDVFKQQLSKLFKKAGAWFDEDKSKISNNAQDAITKIDFLLYPEGAEEIKSIVSEMQDRNEFTDCDNLKIHAVPETTNLEGIVKISMRFGYSLESYEPFYSHKRSEEKMVSYRPLERRSILKDYSEFPCPLDDFTSGDIKSITLGSEDFDEAAKWFVWAHNYNLLEERRRTGKTEWIFHIEDNYTGDKTREMPGKVKVRIALNDVRNSAVDSETLKKLYVATRGEDVSVLKLGAAIMQQEDLRSKVEETESNYRRSLKEKAEYSNMTDVEIDREILKSYLSGPKIREIEQSGRSSAAIEAEFIRRILRLQLH